MENIYVHKSDARMEYLEKLLEDRSSFEPLHVYAPNIKLSEETLGESGIMIVGKLSDDLRALAASRGMTAHEILLDEDFQAVNSRLTAEGALMIAIQNSPLSISEARALILGFGRMGAALAKLLGGIGARFDIATSNPRPARAFAAHTVGYDCDLGGYDIIFNTAPNAVISDSTLTTAKRGAVYIDLASIPAVNLEYARYLGLNADIYPALPAKVCPMSAAKAMYDYISEVMRW